jgi:hypothetical protein
MLLERVGSVLRELGIPLPRRRTRNQETAQDVREGMSFARLIAANVTETARVLEVIPDSAGIPHIRYSVEVRDQSGRHDEGSRVLAQSSFLALYRRLK